MKRFYQTLLFVLVIAGCSPAMTQTPAAMTPSDWVAEARTLNVFAAASLTDAFTEIGQNFEAAHPGITVTFNFAGSQALRTQIEEGAPADVFASANQTEMDHLISAGFVAQGASQVLLNNKLVVILPADNPAALAKLEDLAKPAVKLVIAAEEVPVGKYTRKSLDQMNSSFGSKFKDKVLANVVSNEDNVRQVVTKVQLGEADAGIVYSSDAVAAPGLKRIEIPAELNVIAEYPVAPLLQSANQDLATTFIEYLLAAEGQAAIQKWGFTPAE